MINYWFTHQLGNYDKTLFINSYIHFPVKLINEVSVVINDQLITLTKTTIVDNISSTNFFIAATGKM